MNRYRVFVLGAGFSKPAGLPLAQVLWKEVLDRARRLEWIREELDYELGEFDRYRSSRGNEIDDQPVDFEDFMAFLDLEHALGLTGSDTFSAEGNRLQLALRWLIAQIIVERTPPPDALPPCYQEFVDALQPHDYVLTFNYDTILENALDSIGRPYRLFPSRYAAVHDGWAEGDSSREEVAVIKLHGSVDWFDRADYTQEEARSRREGGPPLPHIVFGPTSPAVTTPLLEGPQFKDEPLLDVHRVIGGLAEVYRRDPPLLVSPVMLAPSYMKVLYADRLRSSFWGLGQIGGYNLGLVVIGYSLPRHDDYARLAFLRMFANYQRSWWDDDFSGMRKKPALLIDFRDSPEAEAAYRSTYSFSEPEKTQFYFDGFDSDAVALIREAT